MYDLFVLFNCLLPCISSSSLVSPLLMGRLVPLYPAGLPAPESCRRACCAAGGAAGAGAGSPRRWLAGSPASLLPALPLPFPARFPPSAAAMAAAPGPAWPRPGPGARRSDLCPHQFVHDPVPGVGALAVFPVAAQRCTQPRPSAPWPVALMTPYGLPVLPRLLRLPPDDALRRVAGDMMSR